MTELVFILDCSGSMSGMESDTIGGFNSMLAKQKKEEGEALVSTVLFANDSTVIHDRLPLSEVPPLTEEEYFTRGCTALLDAVGGAIHHIGNIHKYAQPGTRVYLTCEAGENQVTITFRNISATPLNISADELMERFVRGDASRNTEGIDAAKEAARFGIGADRAVNYKCDEAGTALNYEVISEAVCSVRAARPLSADWKRRIDEDVQKRGR